MPTGFFGKMPAAGDFVSRGLTPGARRVLDLWLTQVIAPARDAGWPEGGLCAAIDGEAGPLALLILPSRDTPGRVFPLAACVVAPPSRSAIDDWASAVFEPLEAATAGEIGPDALAEALAAIASPTGPADLEPPCLWAEGGIPGPPDAVIAAMIAAQF